jgi:hypothetical protein
MFRASLCPSSGAYQLQQQQPLVYRRNVVVAVLLVVVGPDRPLTTVCRNPQDKCECCSNLSSQVSANYTEYNTLQKIYEWQMYKNYWFLIPNVQY